MENLDYIAAGLALIIFFSGLLMMFTNIWTTKDK